MRAESAVEPTKSENITVTWRRSAVSCGATVTAAAVGGGAFLCALLISAIARSNLRRWPSDATPISFEVLIRQIRKDAEIDLVLGKALSVLPEAELLKPVRNLLHRGPRLVPLAQR